MKFTTIILNILLLSISFKEYRIFNNIKDSLEIRSKNSLYYKQTVDTNKPNNKNKVVSEIEQANKASMVAVNTDLVLKFLLLLVWAHDLYCIIWL